MSRPAKIKRRLKKILAVFYKITLKNQNFSIISNNCWGGVVYDKYSLKYLSPTIGLWIPPKDFVRFCENLEYYLNKEIVQINYKESHVSELLKNRKETGRYKFDLNSLIIGRIEDIDIIFIHYNSFDEAKEKWNRRKKRINFNNIIFKLNDQNDCTLEDCKKFLNLKYKNKLFFTSKKDWCIRNECIFIKKYQKYGYVLNDTIYGSVPINTTKYLNAIQKKGNM